MTHKDTLGRDSEGRYRRRIGWKVGNGKLVQHQFRLGRFEAQARIANVRLEALWECVEKRWVRLKDEGRITDPVPLWDGITLAIGQCIARGDAVCTLPVSPEIAEVAGRCPMGVGAWLRAWQKDLPGIPLQLPEEWRELDQGVMDQERATAEERLAQARKDVEVNQHWLNLIGAPTPTGPTLHQVLDLFSEHLASKYRTADGRISPTARLHQRQVRQIKEHQADMPLSSFGLNEVEALVNYWRNRPITMRGKPASPDTVRDVIKRIKTFIKWLHKEPSIPWRKPADLEWERVRIPLSPAEVSAKATPHQVETWTLDELCTLYEYATPFERLPMLLALNCGFGQAEVLTLQKAEVHDDCIRRLRYKTQTYGEWKLWSVTKQGIDWMLKFHQGDVSSVIVTKKGEEVKYLTNGSNRSAKLANAWAGLIRRIKKDRRAFRELSFNKLRKTAGNLIREIAGGEVAGVFLCHGQAVSDDLIEVYTNRNFSQVFAAIRTMEERLAPMFARSQDPFPEDYRKSNPAISFGKIKRIRELQRQGYKLNKIAELVGCNRNTVAKWVKRGQPSCLVQERAREDHDSPPPPERCPGPGV